MKVEKKIKQVDFYCRVCKKSMKMAYVLSGDNDSPVLPGMIIRCHTNKCTRVAVLKKHNEGMIKALMDKEGRVFI